MTDPNTPPTGPVFREAADGEQVIRFAREAGFRTLAPVFDAPENAALKQKRVNPNTINPGDVVVIPELDPKVKANAATNQVHLFTLTAEELLLNLTLENEARKPLANRAFRFVFGQRSLTNPTPDLDPPADGVTDAKGKLSVVIGLFTSEGELTVHQTNDPASPVVSVIRVLISVLRSPDTVEGQRTRLNNMGYFAGFSDNDRQQLKWAIEEFQFDHGIKPTGSSTDSKTFNKIAHEHGDLLPNETVP